MSTKLSNQILLDNNVKGIVAGEIDVNLEDPEHTRAVAYMKKHVSLHS